MGRTTSVDPSSSQRAVRPKQIAVMDSPSAKAAVADSATCERRTENRTPSEATTMSLSPKVIRYEALIFT